MKVTTTSNQETADYGQKLASTLTGGDILCLYGDLGAGKTTLVKGIARGLGIKDNITSPTFTLMNFYKGTNTTLIHIDTYRLKNEQELVEIGALDYIGQPDTIAIIEWPEKIAGLLKNKKVINVIIDHQEETVRSITIS